MLPILPVAQCTMHPGFSRDHISFSACFQNVPVTRICEALMQSNPLTYVNLYAFNLAARLGDRLGWIFFQTLLDGCSFAPWPLWQDAASSWLPSEVCTEVQRHKGTVLGNAVFYINLTFPCLGLCALMAWWCYRNWVILVMPETLLIAWDSDHWFPKSSTGGIYAGLR